MLRGVARSFPRHDLTAPCIRPYWRANGTYKAGLEFFDDSPDKPVRIWSRVGRRPILAAGNANGDIEMLRFSGGTSTPALVLLDLETSSAPDTSSADMLAELVDELKTMGMARAPVRTGLAGVLGKGRIHASVEAGVGAFRA